MTRIVEAVQDAADGAARKHGGKPSEAAMTFDDGRMAPLSNDMLSRVIRPGCVTDDRKNGTKGNKPVCPLKIDGQAGEVAPFSATNLDLGRVFTHFDKVRSDSDDVAVLVSDLFLFSRQVVGDTRQLLKPLKAYMDSGWAVSILSVWTAFEGKVFDLPQSAKKDRTSVPHNGLMPLHVVFVGPSSKIAAIEEELVRKVDAIDKELKREAGASANGKPSPENEKGLWHLVRFQPDSRISVSAKKNDSPAAAGELLKPLPKSAVAGRTGFDGKNWRVELPRGRGTRMERGIDVSWMLELEPKQLPVSPTLDVQVKNRINTTASALSDLLWGSRNKCTWELANPQKQITYTRFISYEETGDNGMIVEKAGVALLAGQELSTRTTGAGFYHAVTVILHQKGWRIPDREEKFLEEYGLRESKAAEVIEALERQEPKTGPLKRLGTLNLEPLYRGLWERAYGGDGGVSEQPLVSTVVGVDMRL